MTGDHLGGPDRLSVRAHDVACTFPPKARSLPEYQAWIVGALDAGGGLRAAVGAEDLYVDDHVGPALVGDLLQGFMQAGGLWGQHGRTRTVPEVNWHIRAPTE